MHPSKASQFSNEVNQPHLGSTLYLTSNIGSCILGICERERELESHYPPIFLKHPTQRKIIDMDVPKQVKFNNYSS